MSAARRPGGLTIVFPAYNEEANVGAAIAAADAAAARHFDEWEIVVVDDGSRDATAERVLEAKASNPRVELIRLPRNRGYGAAVKTGLQAARMRLVFFTDSDLQFDLEQIPDLLARIDECPVVIGWRRNRRDHWMREWNAWAWGRLQRLLFGLRVRDIDCAFKLFRREVLEGMPMRSDGAFISTELLLRAQAAGWKICEVPVDHFPRRAGAPTGARLSVILKAFRELAELRRELRGQVRAGVPRA